MRKASDRERTLVELSAICLLLALLSVATQGQTPGLADLQPATLSVGTSNAAPIAPSTPGEAPVLRIGPGDLLDISIFDTPELSQKVRVDTQGTVELVIGGALPLAGLTPAEAGRLVEKRLREAGVLRNPRVSINVLEFATQGISVVGEVKNPGTYPLLAQSSVLDLISSAGGLTQYASRTALLTHRGENSPITVDLSQPAAVATLLPGDRIVVARAGTVYVLGDVGKPGGFMLDERNTMSVLQALALAQGLNRTAKSQSSLIRNTPAGPQQEPLDLKKILANQSPDPPLRDGDIVYVPLNAAKDWASRGINSIMQMAVGVVIYGRY